MPKAAASSLTGGTGDVNPQWLSAAAGVGQLQTGTSPGSSASLSQQTQIPVPVPRFSVKDGKSIVMEVLKIVWAYGVDLPINTDNSFELILNGYLSTIQPQPASAASSIAGTTVDYYSAAFTETQTNAIGVDFLETIPSDNPTFHDITDGAGHGVLVATDNVWLTLNATATVFNSTQVTIPGATITARMLYRFKEVTLQEYIGIVQSQQSR